MDGNLDIGSIFVPVFHELLVGLDHKFVVKSIWTNYDKQFRDKVVIWACASQRIPEEITMDMTIEK